MVSSQFYSLLALARLLLSLCMLGHFRISILALVMIARTFVWAALGELCSVPVRMSLPTFPSVDGTLGHLS